MRKIENSSLTAVWFYPEIDEIDDVDAKQYHRASFSTRNSALNTSLREPIRMQDFIQLCDSRRNPFSACARTSNRQILPVRLPGVRKGFTKGDLRLLRTNSSKATLEEKSENSFQLILKMTICPGQNLGLAVILTGQTRSCTRFPNN